MTWNHKSGTIPSQAFHSWIFHHSTMHINKQIPFDNFWTSQLFRKDVFHLRLRKVLLCLHKHRPGCISRLYWQSFGSEGPSSQRLDSRALEIQINIQDTTGKRLLVIQRTAAQTVIYINMLIIQSWFKAMTIIVQMTFWQHKLTIMLF